MKDWNYYSFGHTTSKNKLIPLRNDRQSSLGILSKFKWNKKSARRQVNDNNDSVDCQLQKFILCSLLQVVIVQC